MLYPVVLLGIEHIGLKGTVDGCKVMRMKTIMLNGHKQLAKLSVYCCNEGFVDKRHIIGDDIVWDGIKRAYMFGSMYEIIGCDTRYDMLDMCSHWKSGSYKDYYCHKECCQFMSHLIAHCFYTVCKSPLLAVRDLCSAIIRHENVV